MEILTTEECKKIILSIGRELNVSPKLIATRLLNDFDKKLLSSGLIEISSLKCSVEVWRDMGMPDHAHGRSVPYSWEANR